MQKQSVIPSKIASVLSRIQQAKAKANITHPVRLVAVSKKKTVQEVMEAYNTGLRHFGENYVHEIQEKQPKLPLDIKWHYIGHLQTNKIKKVLVPNLHMIETIDSENLAIKVQKQLKKQNRNLDIYIQIKTSQEERKTGIEIQSVDGLYNKIKTSCPHLNFKGLMTIGKQGDLSIFTTMCKLKEEMCQKYKLNVDQFELSMGMSADFQVAVEHRSTNVRVGTEIFGPTKPEAKTQEPQSKQQEAQK